MIRETASPLVQVSSIFQASRITDCGFMIHPEPYMEGLRLYWRGYYWHSHEEWEELWRASEPPQSFFLRGLIQIDAALIHTEWGHWQGVANLLGRSLDNLSRCPDELMGMDIVSVRRQVECYRRHVLKLLYGKRDTFDWRLKPRLEIEGIPYPPRQARRRAKGDLPGKADEDSSQFPVLGWFMSWVS